MTARAIAAVAVLGCLGIGPVGAAAGTGTKVAAGSDHSCALTAGGGVKCWGANNAGQVGDGTYAASRPAPTDVIGLTSGVTAVSAGGRHTCAITSTGGLRCWGDNGDGQLGGTPSSANTPVAVTGLASGVVAVAAGGSHTCAVTSEGGVKCWGGNTHGQLGDGTTTERETPVSVIGLTSGVVAVAAGYSHTCAMTVTGGAKCWGWNYGGSLGDGTTTERHTPRDVVGLASGVVAIAAGGNHSCAVIAAGALKCWGLNDAGQLGDGTTSSKSTPVDVVGLAASIAEVTGGGGHTCASTTSGSVQCWGSNFAGQLGDGTRTSRSFPAEVSALEGGVVALAAYYLHACAMTDVGRVLCWGDNRNGELGDAGPAFRTTPRDVSGLTASMVAVAPGGNDTCALTSGGGVKCWGLWTAGLLGPYTEDEWVPWLSVPRDVVGLQSGVAAVTTGSDHACVLTAGGGVKCWGSNSYEALGDCYSGAWRATPEDVPGLTSGVVAISAGGSHTCALTSGGGLKCWGSNSRGQIGDGGSMIGGRCPPADVSGLASGVVAVAAGGTHTCALTSAGGVKCWGNNDDGQVGAWGPSFTTPVDVVGLTSGVQAVEAGGRYTCALTTAGGVKCWGYNAYGQLGDGTTTDRTTPVDVTGMTSGMLAVAAGGTQTCARTSGGGVKCWGGNAYGEVGDGTTTRRTTSVDVSGLTAGAVSIMAGGYHTCAVTTAGGIKCWGDDEYGKLGNGRWLRRTRPYPVKGFGPAVTFGDFNGDGRADYAVFRPSTGTWLVHDVGSWAFGAQGDMPVPADYDGDGGAELGVYRPETSRWAVKDVALEMTSPQAVCGTGADPCDQSQAGTGQVEFGAKGDVPVPADYDGDGRSDIAVYRPATGAWIIRGGSTIVWGGAADRPVPADYDGDGRAEFAVFRPSDGTWGVRDVGTWTLGVSGDVPVPADYDGDGLADAAVYRPSTATWYVRGQGAWQFGQAGDVPVPLDLDADGRVELVVYRPSSSTWYSLAPATGAQTTVQFGTPGDVPALMRPFVAPRSSPSDFTGDLKSDLLWRHASGGDLWLWPMDGGEHTAESYVSMVDDAAWEIRGLGDQTGDGRADLLWRHATTGQIYLWTMDGSTVEAMTYVGTVDLAFDIVGTGDYDGDRKSDILWRHQTTGELWLWAMNGPDTLSVSYVDTVDLSYEIQGTGDLNADGKADLVWQGTAGDVWVWLMNGAEATTVAYVTLVPDRDYRVAGVADYTGDGNADLLWHHATRGEVWLWAMNGTVAASETYVGTVPDTAYRIVGTGDYDGDAKADILWHHATSGEVWVWLMNGAVKLSEHYVGTVPDTGYRIVR